MKRWLLFTLVFVASQLTASEGMWTPAQLPDLAAELKQRGLQLDPRTMTDLTAHPMNAIISLGGCTASFVSPRGLAVTNHHCAYGAISYNSTEERNLLRDGFVAANQGEDVFAGPGSRILVTVEVLDVTDKVLGELADGLDGRARYQAIEDTNKALVRSCEEDEGHRCRVTAYHGGLRYELIKQCAWSMRHPSRLANSVVTSTTGCGRVTPATSAFIAPTWVRTANRPIPMNKTSRTSPGTGCGCNHAVCRMKSL
jgi:hypothetical protein